MQSIITLPSGAELKITLSPFSVSKDLYQALLKELKALKLDPKAEVDVNFFKDLFCAAFTSKEVETALKKCFEKCIYNDSRITNVDDIFENENARDDYFTVCFEVAKANIMPFTKSLYAQYSHIFEMLKTKDPA